MHINRGSSASGVQPHHSASDASGSESGAHLKQAVAGGEIVRRGARGDAVKDLQSLLNQAGANPRLTADGVFGAGTERALKSFQSQHGLGADGKLGPNSLRVLLKEAGGTTENSAPVEHGGGSPAVDNNPEPPAPQNDGVGQSIQNTLDSGGRIRKGARGAEVRDLQELLNRAGANPKLKVDGDYGGGTERAIRDFQRRHGLVADGKFGPNTWSALKTALGISFSARPVEHNPGGPVEGYQPSTLTYRTNSTAVSRARSSSLGRSVPSAMAKYAEIYKKASALTGVPAELIAAVHANESQFGAYRSSSHGPESGFGLDPRYVKSDWANDHLRRYGLGTWDRGNPTDRGVLQSAVVAAEHLKRNAKYAGVTIDRNMNQNELAAVVTSYIAGPGAGKKALTRGSSWVFDPADANPHPYHPGGTSIGSNGQTIRVRPSRKEGLLRWDALLPLFEEYL